MFLGSFVGVLEGENGMIFLVFLVLFRVKWFQFLAGKNGKNERFFWCLFRLCRVGILFEFFLGIFGFV